MSQDMQNLYIENNETFLKERLIGVWSNHV